MSFLIQTLYLAHCDYPWCDREYDFGESSSADVTETLQEDSYWLCLFAKDGTPRFFCPAHLALTEPNVFFDSDDPKCQPKDKRLNAFYEDVSEPQPLPKPECEEKILDSLLSEAEAGA